ncbi:MAG: lysostaphin resistance A-like protein [Bacilli bacterium]
MEKSLNKFMLFIGLFILDILYSSIVVALLNCVGINILELNNTLKYLSLIIIDLSFMFILYLIYRKELNNEFIKYIKNFKDNFSFGLKLWILGLILMISSNLIIQIIYPSVATNEEAVQESLKMFPIYTAFASCIFAPFVEEIIFRKCLGKVFKNSIIFIIISGLLFGLAHTITEIGTSQMLYIIPYGLFGAIFAYMYTKTKNIFVSMTFHFIHNTILVILSLLSVGVI